jgi:hypothetical protein
LFASYFLLSTVQTLASDRKAEAVSYYRNLWIDDVMKKAAYPSA